jgi:molybdopterin-guanine dinucleotide biosynthesis protein A
LLQRQIDVLRAAGAATVNVSVAPGRSYKFQEAGAVADEVPEAGPLAGIAAGLRVAPAGLVLVLAVDLAWITEAHLRRLVELATDTCGVVPVRGGICEALVAAYPTTLAGSAQAVLAEAPRAPHAWVRAEAARGRLRLWEAPEDWAVALHSWNTPDDLPRP